MLVFENAKSLELLLIVCLFDYFISNLSFENARGLKLLLIVCLFVFIYLFILFQTFSCQKALQEGVGVNPTNWSAMLELLK